MPNDKGNGPAMRAALFIRALAPHYRIYLHVIPVLGVTPKSNSAHNCLSQCTEVFVQALENLEDPVFTMINNLNDQRLKLAALAGYRHPLLGRFATPQAIAALQTRYASYDFSIIHVFRLYLAYFAKPFGLMSSERKIMIQLDLDDYESKTYQRIAILHDANQNTGLAYLQGAEASKYEILENQLLPLFDTVYTSNQVDQTVLAQRFQANFFQCVPNAITVNPSKLYPLTRSNTLTLLFVGTLSYFPNEDAVLYFCNSVLPILQNKTKGATHFLIVGANPSQKISELTSLQGVEVMGWADDLNALYAKADAVVVPIRAGGGTRIKILEAFAQCCPVIATSLGAEGIDAHHEKHLLIADTAQEFVQACLRLQEQVGLASSLTKQAYQLVTECYSVAAVSERIRQLMPVPVS